MAQRSIIPLVLSVFLIACQSKTNTPWIEQEMSTHCLNSDSIRLTYPPQEPSEGFELELLLAQDELTSYINLFLYPLPFKHRTTYSLTFTCENETVSYPAYLHRGGQKLTLSKEAQDHLLSLLKQEKSVHISFDRHSQLIIGEGFQKYKKIISKICQN